MPDAKRSTSGSTAIGIVLVVVGIAACSWVAIYAITNRAAIADIPWPLSQYICVYGGPAALAMGVELLVVDVVHRARNRQNQ